MYRTKSQDGTIARIEATEWHEKEADFLVNTHFRQISEKQPETHTS